MNIILRLIISIIDVIFIYKNKKKIVIPCTIDSEWQGNCAFLFKHLILSTDFNVIVLCSKKSSLFKNTDTKNNAIYIYSVRGLWHLLTSSIVIYHHGPLAGRIPLLPFNRLNLQINHGIHYKKVELALSPSSKEYKNKSIIKTKWFCKKHTVSSHIDALSCCTYYHVNLYDVHITGIARNDIFFHENQNVLPSSVIDDFIKIKNIIKDKKVILYAPTWRNVGGAYPFIDDEVNVLNNFLRENNYIFFYAGHPYLKDRKVPTSDYVVDYNIFNDIQSILYFTDVLITDYSSIWIDFLLKEKPIINFQFDIDEYKDDRGFLFNVNSIFPGETVYTFNDLIATLINLKFNENKYKFVKDLFHEFHDGQNCQRIENIIKNIKS
ncbi:CDP-glycerol glycerophosphotransferase family protein [Morganella morganii]|uniref:CDP-glycerol glycerophosphotransferase family protein n=1 Tax=Morganella morganii TaxID=582 RepID=UPI0034E3FBA3